MTDTTHAGSQVTAIVVLTAAAILRGGAAAADPNQDDQFLALLDKEGIPALTGVPSLIDTAHKVCRNLDAGMPVDTMVDTLVNYAYSVDPSERLYAPGRLARTEARFIIAAVEAYCPYDQGKIASVMANPAPGSHEPTHRVAANTHNAVSSGGDLREPPPALDMIDLLAPSQEPTGTGAVRLPHLMDGGVSVASRRGDDRSDCDAHGTMPASLIGAIPGEVPPSPPQIPAPPPPTAQRLTPPRPIAAPPPPKQPPPPPQQPPPPPEQPPPPPQQPPPPPQQVEPPAVGPQPGAAPGSGGGGGGNGGGGNGSGSPGGNGGGGPVAPAPAPPMPPGFVRLAP
jgi:Protein of unknown function (DUF732)